MRPYVENLTTGETELHDLERDPLELVNLSGRAAHAGLERALAAELHAWRRAKEPAK